MLRQLEFAQDVLTQSCGASEYLSKIVFSNECIFRVNGHVNKQNVRIWAKDQPTQVNQAPSNSPGFMVWFAIAKTKIIVPVFFENEIVTGASY